MNRVKTNDWNNTRTSGSTSANPNYVTLNYFWEPIKADRCHTGPVIQSFAFNCQWQVMERMFHVCKNCLMWTSTLPCIRPSSDDSISRQGNCVDSTLPRAVFGSDCKCISRDVYNPIGLAASEHRHFPCQRVVPLSHDRSMEWYHKPRVIVFSKGWVPRGQIPQILPQRNKILVAKRTIHNFKRSSSIGSGRLGCHMVAIASSLSQCLKFVESAARNKLQITPSKVFCVTC